MNPVDPEVIRQCEEQGAWKGKKNIYTCDACHGHVVTVDVDAGVTPFMIGCRCLPLCKGKMVSSMYRVFDQNMAPDFEWYRPEDLDAVKPGEHDHVARGGLLLRPALSKEDAA